MFDLEKAVANWRREIQAKWSGNTASLDEIEDHLREETAALVRSGNAEEQAWRVALAKLGDPVALRQEFAKVESLSRFDHFMLGAMAACAALTVLALVILFVARGPNLAADPVLFVHILTITLGYTTGIFVALLAGYVTVRDLSKRRSAVALHTVSKRWLHVACIAAAGLTIVGFTFGAIWANGTLGKAFTFDPREFGGILVAAGLIAAAVVTRRGNHSTSLSQALPVFAGGLVMLAWFGANAYLSGFPVLPTIIGFGGLAIAVVLAALALRNRTASEAM